MDILDTFIKERENKKNGELLLMKLHCFPGFGLTSSAELNSPFNSASNRSLGACGLAFVKDMRFAILATPRHFVAFRHAHKRAKEKLKDTKRWKRGWGGGLDE